MESTKEIIEKRKSVRHFLDKDVSVDAVYDILDCARLAPSAKNKQPWRFYVLSKKEKEEVVRMFFKKLHENNTEDSGLASARIAEQAKRVVLVFMDGNEIESEGLSLTPYYLSVGACIENALLRATELGIGSLWIYDAIVIEKELSERFCKNCKYVSMLCFGYEDTSYDFKAKKKPLDDVILNKTEEN